MKTTFGAITQPYIKNKLSKKKTRVLALLIFYEIRKNPKEIFQSVELCYLYNNRQLCLY